MLRLQYPPIQPLERGTPDLLRASPVFTIFASLPPSMLHYTGSQSEPQLVSLVRKVLDQNIRVANMSLLEVCHKLLSFESGKDESLTAAAKARHFVDTSRHRANGIPAKREVEEYQSRQTSVKN
jgi:hypothetical protein